MKVNTHTSQRVQFNSKKLCKSTSFFILRLIWTVILFRVSLIVNWCKPIHEYRPLVLVLFLCCILNLNWSTTRLFVAIGTVLFCSSGWSQESTVTASCALWCVLSSASKTLEPGTVRGAKAEPRESKQRALLHSRDEAVLQTRTQYLFSFWLLLKLINLT